MRRGFRKIHKPDGIWEYKIGKYSVIIFSPKGTKYCTNESILTGINPSDLERAYWKGYATGVHPHMISNYIDRLPLDK